MAGLLFSVLLNPRPSAFVFLLRDKESGTIIPTATVSFTLNREYPLLGRLTFLPSNFRGDWKTYSAKTSDGIIRLPSQYPGPEKWFFLKAEGYEETPFNMDIVLEAHRNSGTSNSVSGMPILYLDRIRKNGQ